MKIERIISNSHTTAEGQWYDQAQDEWVVVIEGSATIMYDNQEAVSLMPGDTLLIPAHKKHRVISTATDKKMIWLAVHCSS